VTAVRLRASAGVIVSDCVHAVGADGTWKSQCPASAVTGTCDGAVTGTGDGAVTGTDDGVVTGTGDGAVTGTGDGAVMGDESVTATCHRVLCRRRGGRDVLSRAVMTGVQGVWSVLQVRLFASPPSAPRPRRPHPACGVCASSPSYASCPFCLYPSTSPSSAGQTE